MKEVQWLFSFCHSWSLDRSRITHKFHTYHIYPDPRSFRFKQLSWYQKLLDRQIIFSRSHAFFAVFILTCEESIYACGQRAFWGIFLYLQFESPSSKRVLHFCTRTATNRQILYEAFLVSLHFVFTDLLKTVFVPPIQLCCAISCSCGTITHGLEPQRRKVCQNICKDKRRHLLRERQVFL